MSLFDSVKMAKNVRKYGLVKAYDEKHHPVIYIGNEYGVKVFIKKFKTDFEFNKFLCEAFLMRCMTHNKDIKKVRDAYNSLVKFIDEKESLLNVE